MAEIHDLDISGKESGNGTPYVLNEYESIEQGLKLFLSYSNDRLYYPEYKGVLKRLAFKNINDMTLIPLKFDIETEIINGFVPNITINNLQIIPDKQNRLLELVLDYTVKGTGKSNSSTFYVKNNNITETEKFNYQDILYTEENLYLWVTTTKYNTELVGKRLSFNYDEDSWTWGKYRLINLNPITDSYFGQILLLINGGEI